MDLDRDSNRVLRVHRDELSTGALTAADVRDYGRVDGLESTEGVKRNSSVVSDSPGRIWFSLARGLSVSTHPTLPAVRLRRSRTLKRSLPITSPSILEKQFESLLLRSEHT